MSESRTRISSTEIPKGYRIERVQEHDHLWFEAFRGDEHIVRHGRLFEALRACVTHSKESVPTRFERLSKP